MALTTNDKVVTTVTGTTTVDTEILTGLIFIKFVYWYNPTTAGHLLSMCDRDGNVIAVARCESDNQSQWLPVWSTFHGVHIDDMDSGTVYIYKT